MPGILFWFLILLLVYFISGIVSRNWEGNSDWLLVIPIIASVLSTIAYIIYAIYWIWTHWHGMPVHINLT